MNVFANAIVDSAMHNRSVEGTERNPQEKPILSGRENFKCYDASRKVVSTTPQSG